MSLETPRPVELSSAGCLGSQLQVARARREGQCLPGRSAHGPEVRRHPASSTLTKGFGTHLPTPNLVTAALISPPAISPVFRFFPGDLVSNPNCSVTGLPLPQGLAWPVPTVLAPHSVLPSLETPLTQGVSPARQGPSHHLSLADILHLVATFAFSTIPLFSFLSQTRRQLNAAGERHKTMKICADKNSVPSLSTTRQRFYMPFLGQLCLPFRTQTIQ